MHPTNVLITMAGMGKRFRDAGYDCPKYCISVHGKTLFAWSMLSLRSFIEAGAAFTFIVRCADQASDFIRAEAVKLNIGRVDILEIDHLTDGQATSALYAIHRGVCNDGPLLIYNIDTFVHPDALPVATVRGDGWIPCFPGKGDGWSFVRSDDNGKIIELREKVRISPHATVGLYWFRSAESYVQAYKSYYADDKNMECGEKYIAPMYNQMIKSGQQVFIHEIPYDAVIPIGTPAELDAFRERQAPVL
jgi:choline kinase